MTEEQFEALITMTRYIVDAAIAGNEFGGIDGSQHLAVRANRMADRMIAEARALLVEKPAKEIQNSYCGHGMLRDNCRIHGCKHTPQDAAESAVHYHITEYSGVAGQTEYVNKLPCSKCNWGH